MPFIFYIFFILIVYFTPALILNLLFKFNLVESMIVSFLGVLSIIGLIDFLKPDKKKE